MSNDANAVSGAGTSAFANGASGFGANAAAAGNAASVSGMQSGGVSGTGASASSKGNGGSGTAANGTSGNVTPGFGTGGMSGKGMGNPLDMGNYFQSGAWMGYVWTSTSGTGSSISPMDFSSQMTGMPRCVKGTVAATTDYSGTAILGVNLSDGMGATSMTITPMKAGVLIDVSNHAGSPLRFQVKSAQTGGTEWCTPITGSGGFIPWTSLRTNCWDTSGVPYNKEPIASAMILVPGTNTAPVMFDFCWNSIAEADAPAGGSAGSGASGSNASGGGGMSGGSGGTNAGQSGSGSGSGGVTGMTVPPVQNGCTGYATRYWDCCKPACGWSANSPSGALASCDQSGNSLGGNVDAANACTGGPAYLCASNTPWAVGSQLSYGFAAVSAATGADICGKCYQLDFTGSSQAGSDAGSAALAGKSMIVQAINIGGDVGSGQFDIAIPGGGVGAYNACSTEWGVPASMLGPTYGGFLTDCKSQSSDHQTVKSCVMQKCTSIFQQKGLTDLAAGCQWFVDWFEVADNPTLKYAEVACPSALMDRGIRRSGGGGGCL